MRFSLTMVAAAVRRACRAAVAQRTGVFDQSMNHPAIKYSTTDSNTVVDELNRKLADGSATLVFDGKTGYLKSVLDLLKIPVESQVLVYTQTSQQASHITMTNPRAIYFNDEVSVGYIRGAGMLGDRRAGRDARLDLLRRAPGRRRAARRFGRESAVPALSPVVGHARRARPERAQHDAAQERSRLRERLLRRSLPADPGTLGRLVRDRQARARAAHGQPAADHGQADRRAAAGARVARRAVRSDAATSRRTATSWR